MKTAVGAFALCVYVHRHRCALSIRLDRVHPVLLYMQVWRRFLLLLILDSKGFPRTSIGKGNASGGVRSVLSYIYPFGVGSIASYP